ncbi:MAG: glutathione S-transferase family protein [Rhodospirillales bacterium]|nr:glutathione S-transferase family protein [Rhodospirillales bacterium]
MLKLCHSGLSTCSKQVRHCLKEKGVAYESNYIELWRYENLNPQYLKLNPNGVVPTLVHDGVPIINAFAINEYIDDAFAGPPLKPDDPKDRARMRHWTFMGDDVHQAIINLTYTANLKSLVDALSEEDKQTMIDHTPMPERRARWVRMSGEGYGEADINAALGKVSYTVAWLEKELANTGWLAGPRFSLADIYLLSNVHRIRELYPDQVDMVAFPRVNEWRDKLMARPAAKEAYAPGTDETPPRPAGKSVDGIFAETI